MKKLKPIPYGRQYIDEEDVQAVLQTLQSDYLTCGEQVEAFENEFAGRVGAKYAVAVNSATAALHLAMRVADIGPGDRVVTTPNTFLSSANCAAFVGATPDFVDIDPIEYTLSPDALESGWKEDTRAVVTVDYAGRPSNYPALAEIARKRGSIIIGDSCHGLGSRFSYNNFSYPLGGHPWADMTTFSFHPVKTLTTGEGGMLVTDNPEFAEKARELRSHGVVRDPNLFQVFRGGNSGGTSELFQQGPWVYEMQELGYNYRLTDLQCALGRSQLRKLTFFVSRRREIVAAYNEAFRDLDGIRTPEIPNPTSPKGFGLTSEDVSWHLYTLLIDFMALGTTRIQVMEQLLDLGVGTQVHYIPVYLQPWYRDTFGYSPGKCPIAESIYLQTLSLPLYPGMGEGDVNRVINAVRRITGS
jgi:UDP-4-amino-4,6-dideoxy-N-acetyl-beta-L-altrosamine transaminase